MISCLQPTSSEGCVPKDPVVRGRSQVGQILRLGRALLAITLIALSPIASAEESDTGGFTWGANHLSSASEALRGLELSVLATEENKAKVETVADELEQIVEQMKKICPDKVEATSMLVQDVQTLVALKNEGVATALDINEVLARISAGGVAETRVAVTRALTDEKGEPTAAWAAEEELNAALSRFAGHQYSEGFDHLHKAFSLAALALDKIDCPFESGPAPYANDSFVYSTVEPDNLGEPTFAIVETELGMEVIQVDLEGDVYLFEGDILVGEKGKLETFPVPPRTTKSIGHSNGNRRWPTMGRIPFELSPAVQGRPAVVTSILAAVANWNVVGLNLTRCPADNCSAAGETDHIRIGFKGIFNASSTRCSGHSPVGRQGGEQELKLHVNCRNTGTGVITAVAEHELGHAIGLWHEQSRSDRNSFVTIFSGNIAAFRAHNFDMRTSSAIRLGSYDETSLMHYGSCTFSRSSSCAATPFGSPNPTIVSNANGIISPSLSRSPGDFRGVEQMYFDTWQVSTSASERWSTLARQRDDLLDWVITGDFDGDYQDDFLLFSPNNTANPRWQILRNDFASWEIYNADPPFGPLGARAAGVGNFDGDHREDVFWADGSSWWYSPAGTEEPVFLATSGFTIEDIHLADFDGDGITDVFRPDPVNNVWKIAWSGQAPWVTVATSSYGLEGLGFGDFDGDGRTDVFRANGSQWFYSPGGQEGWEPLNTSGYQLDALRFADVDGDGRTDVLRSNGVTWQVSLSGEEEWLIWNRSSMNLQNAWIGNFDGNATRTVPGPPIQRQRTGGTDDIMFPWARRD